MAQQPLVTVSRVGKDGRVFSVKINRPDARNAVDYDTAKCLYDTFRKFELDTTAKVGVLSGSGGTFCAGADLKKVQSMVGSLQQHDVSNLTTDVMGPMGPSRMLLSKPVIAAVEGYAVAGGLELSLWCDMRIAEEDSIMGVFCRRFGVPLIDGGTIRLPRIIGLGRALDMILTGRPVSAQEALTMGLVNRVVPKGQARQAAEALADQIANFPEACMRADRLSTYNNSPLPLTLALQSEYAGSFHVLAAESVRGAASFTQGVGRGGSFNLNTKHNGNNTNSSNNNNISNVSGSKREAVPAITTVIFDIGGVIVDSPVRLVVEYERELGLEDFSINRALFKSTAFQQLERSEIDRAKFVDIFQEEWAKLHHKLNNNNSKPVQQPDVNELLRRIGQTARLRSHYLRAMKALKEKGFRIGIITNNFKDPSTGKLLSIFSPFVEVVIQSCEVGIRKPDPAIFQLACSRLQVQPSECLFVDDLEVNIKAAQKLGMNVVRVRGSDKDGWQGIKDIGDVVGLDLVSLVGTKSSL